MRDSMNGMGPKERRVVAKLGVKDLVEGLLPENIDVVRRGAL